MGIDRVKTVNGYRWLVTYTSSDTDPYGDTEILGEYETLQEAQEAIEDDIWFLEVENDEPMKVNLEGYAIYERHEVEIVWPPRPRPQVYRKVK